MNLQDPDDPVVMRFRSKVDRGGPGECWPWTAGTQSKGYGAFGVPGRGVMTAHRVAWALDRGEWPNRGLLIRHSCHNRTCCNPAHLQLGQAQDNADDMVEAGRSLTADRNGRAKLSWDQVWSIRMRYTGAYGQVKALAEEFGVCTRTIREAAHGKSWAS